MAKRDFSKLSLEQLKAERDEIDRAIAQHGERRKREARAELEKKAKEFGLTLEEIVGGGKPKAKSGKKSAGLPPKYRNPDDPSQTWSGRGRQPGWYKERLEKGAAPESMAV